MYYVQEMGRVDRALGYMGFLLSMSYAALEERQHIRRARGEVLLVGQSSAVAV